MALKSSAESPGNPEIFDSPRNLSGRGSLCGQCAEPWRSRRWDRSADLGVGGLSRRAGVQRSVIKREWQSPVVRRWDGPALLVFEWCGRLEPLESSVTDP